MNRLSYCGLALLLAVAFADAKPARRPLEPDPPGDARILNGVYALSHKNDANRSGVVRMRIWDHQGNTFAIGISPPSGNPGVDWVGRGVLDGDKGYYDWTFPDGKKGRTTFVIDKAGNIHGQVRGSGIDWDYVGTRVEERAKVRDVK